MKLSQTQKTKILIRGSDDLVFFTNNIFSEARGILRRNEFIGGPYIDSISEYLQNSKKTCRVSARDHFKSMSFYDHFCWMCTRHVNTSLEAHYFSFNSKMAGYHTEKIKKAIISNPFLNKLHDAKKTAESILKFTWDGEHFITLEPHGLLEFNRGIHAPLIYVDDPFQDPANKLNITVINKINDVIKTQIMDMSHDQLHIAGTPQTKQDFFFDKEALHDFNVRIQPAIISEKKKIVLWKQWKNWDDLQAIKRNKGMRIFRQEYLCSPAYSEDSYFNEELAHQINPELKNYQFKNWHKEIERRKKNKEETENDIIAGLDIGKKRHPSCLVVFEIVGTKQIQRHVKHMDKWEYHKQLRYCEEAIEAFGIDILNYDSTRGEFETFEEAGKMPAEMEPINFTRKRKNAMAAGWDKASTNNTIELIDDRRQIEQIKAVDSDLNALETPEGHGEAFFAISLIYADAVEDEEEEPEQEEKKHHMSEKELLDVDEFEDEDEFDHVLI